MLRQKGWIKFHPLFFCSKTVIYFLLCILYTDVYFNKLSCVTVR
nr:MAG TPA: hypothetical protein [Caudoviricetes sp.]